MLKYWFYLPLSTDELQCLCWTTSYTDVEHSRVRSRVRAGHEGLEGVHEWLGKFKTALGVNSDSSTPTYSSHRRPLRHHRQTQRARHAMEAATDHLTKAYEARSIYRRVSCSRAKYKVLRSLLRVSCRAIWELASAKIRILWMTKVSYIISLICCLTFVGSMLGVVYKCVPLLREREWSLIFEAYLLLICDFD